MKRFLFGSLPVFALLGVLMAEAQDLVKDRLEKSDLHHEWQKVKTKKGREVKTFIVFPEVNKPATAVVIIHENKGLADWVRSVADQVAEAGYVALAPDFLTGLGPDGGDTDSFKSVSDITKRQYMIPHEQIMSDLDAVVDYARGLKSTNDKVAVAGFCWGGGKSFAYAAHNPDIAAAFVFYGSALKDDAEYKKIRVPVYGFYGGNDARITSEVPDVTKKMKTLNKTYEPVTYPGAGHGFMRTGEMPGAKKADSEGRAKAWQRWKEILKAL